MCLEFQTFWWENQIYNLSYQYRKNKSLDEITANSNNSSNNIAAEIVVPVALAVIATILLILAVFVFR